MPLFSSQFCKGNLLVFARHDWLIFVSALVVILCQSKWCIVISMGTAPTITFGSKQMFKNLWYFFFVLFTPAGVWLLFNTSIAQISLWIWSNVLYNSRGNQINIAQITILQLLFNKSNQMLVLGEQGKPEYPGKDLSEQSREPTNSIPIWHWVQKSNLGHIGGRQVLSPLGQPCHLLVCWFFCFLCFTSSAGSTGFYTVDESTFNRITGMQKSTMYYKKVR